MTADVSDEELDKVLGKPLEAPARDGWGCYITGYNPGEGFVGGTEPAPKLEGLY